MNTPYTIRDIQNGIEKAIKAAEKSPVGSVNVLWELLASCETAISNEDLCKKLTKDLRQAENKNRDVAAQRDADKAKVKQYRDQARREEEHSKQLKALVEEERRERQWEARENASYKTTLENLLGFTDCGVFIEEVRLHCARKRIPKTEWSRIVREKVAARAKERKNRDKLDSPVSILEMSVRTANVLDQAGIHWIGQLVQKQETDLLSLKNAGRKTVKELTEFLDELGLCLGTILTDWEPPKTAQA
jgi:hypothetical protein